MPYVAETAAMRRVSRPVGGERMKFVFRAFCALGAVFLDERARGSTTSTLAIGFNTRRFRAVILFTLTRVQGDSLRH